MHIVSLRVGEPELAAVEAVDIVVVNETVDGVVDRVGLVVDGHVAPVVPVKVEMQMS